jgi:hypothetical protein
LKAFSHAQPFEPLFLSFTQFTSEKTKTLQSVATSWRHTASRLGAGCSQHRFGLKPGWLLFNPLKTKRRFLYLKAPALPLWKHFSSRL